MSSKISSKRLVITATFAALAIVGCSSDSNDEGDGNDNPVIDPTLDPDPVTSDPDASFFNDDRSVNFANGIGSSISKIFTSAFSAAPLLLGTTSGDAAPRLARASESGTDTCTTAGSINYTFVTDDTTEQPVSASMTFNDCNEEGVVSSGGLSMNFSGDFDSDNGGLDLTFDDFTVTSQGEMAMIDGDVGMQGMTVGDTFTATVAGTSLAMSSTGGIEDSSVSFTSFQMTSIDNDTTGDSSLSGQSGITTPEGTINLTIDPPFQVLGDADFPTSGVMMMNAFDGSSLLIDADSGDPATFAYTINDQGAISSGTANWEDSGIDIDVNSDF